MDRDRLRKVSNRFTISDIYVAKWNSGWRYFFTKYPAGYKDDTLHRTKMANGASPLCATCKTIRQARQISECL